MAVKDNELLESQKKTNKAVEVAWKFLEYIGNLGNVVNKAKLYDKGMEQLELASKAKINKVLVDYSAKME